MVMGLMIILVIGSMAMAYIYFINFQEYSGQGPEGPDVEIIENNYQGVLGLYRLHRSPFVRTGSRALITGQDL